MRPRFSVVIAVQDRADVVGRAVASVLAQTFIDLEVVVVDDGSVDHSVAAARAVADGRVRVVRQERRGVAAARAGGLERARGDWLSILDPDDEVGPGWLARMGRLLDATGAAVASCGGEQVHLDGSRTTVTPTPVPGAAAGDLRVCCRSGSVVVRRDMVETRVLAGARGEEIAAALAQVAAGGGRIVATPEPLVRWNDPVATGPGDGRSRTGEELRLRWALQSIDALARSPIPDVDQLVRSATSGGIAAARLGDHGEARRLFRLARRMAPDAPRHWARWIVACLPPLAIRVWSDPVPITAHGVGR